MQIGHDVARGHRDRCSAPKDVVGFRCHAGRPPSLAPLPDRLFFPRLPIPPRLPRAAKWSNQCGPHAHPRHVLLIVYQTVAIGAKSGLWRRFARMAIFGLQAGRVGLADSAHPTSAWGRGHPVARRVWSINTAPGSKLRWGRRRIDGLLFLCARTGGRAPLLALW